MQLARYNLNLQVTITKDLAVDSLSGSPITDDVMAEHPDVRIRWQPSYDNDRLTITEAVNLGALDFTGAMRVLGQLHDAMHAIGNPPEGIS